MNEGKKFEQNFKKSVPKDVYYLRLNDSSIGFDIENSTQRFALKSPYDCILYSHGRMYCLELKSTNSRSISFNGSSPMIKKHQVESLIFANGFGCISGFILNFRISGNTYFLPIRQFLNHVDKAIKKSIFGFA